VDPPVGGPIIVGWIALIAALNVTVPQLEVVGVIIRAMGGTGSVVTAAGLVFAFTMMPMSVSAMVVVAQVGTMIDLVLLFDTLVIRAFMAPAIAALLGRWFWWSQVVRARPAAPGTRIPRTSV
jgi:putative drug exporter of the RND superfamily